MMKAFDAPSREECTALRARSNNALAALTLLNDPTFVEAAKMFASRIASLHDTDDTAKIRQAFRSATSRQPTEYEFRVLHELLSANRIYYHEHSSEAVELLHVGLASIDSKTIDAAELASWTMVTRAILNLNETITRN
jgi:hypothetical protein